MQAKKLTRKLPVVATLAAAVIPLAAGSASATTPRWVTLNSVTQTTWYKSSFGFSPGGLQDIVPVSPGVGTYRFVFTPVGVSHLAVKYIQWGYHCTTATFQTYYVNLDYPNEVVPQIMDNTPSFQSPSSQSTPFGDKPTTATLPASFQVTIPAVPRILGPAARPPVLLGCWLQATAGQSGQGIPKAVEQQVVVKVQRAG
jgi:hypothetical protein